MGQQKRSLDQAFGLIELEETDEGCYKCICIECETGTFGCGRCTQLHKIKGPPPQRCTERVVSCPHLKPRKDIDYDEWEKSNLEP